jgi:hypothetical protein
MMQKSVANFSLCAEDVSIPEDVIRKRGMNFLPTAKRIVENAVRESGVRNDGPYSGWLDHPANQAALILLAYVHAEEKRRNGGQSRLVHFICSAHIQANEPDLIDRGHKTDLLAFRTLLHDLIEDTREREFQPLVALQHALSYWTSSDEERRDTKRSILWITDKKGLSGIARIDEQGARMAKGTREQQYERVSEKKEQNGNDVRHFEESLKQAIEGKLKPDQILTLAKDAAVEATKAREKHERVVTKADHVRPALIEENSMLVERLERAAEKFQDMANRIDTRAHSAHTAISGIAAG